jgi:uncharacterized OB-fold protein
MAGAVPTSRGSVPPGGPPEPPFERPPVLLDFFPMEEAQQTRLSRFFEELRMGRLMTTRCPRDATLSWPPRVVCPKCHAEDLEWVELPRKGTVYAFSAVLVGAPMGMEADVPFVVGLIDLAGVPLRLFGRIVGRTWDRCTVGMAVTAEPFDLPDGRVFYRFRTQE